MSSSDEQERMGIAEVASDYRNGSVTTLEDGMMLDYITNKPVKDTPKEQVRQRIARALFHEHGISVDDMEPDFKMAVDGRRKRIDIAIFEPGAAHDLEHLRRVVICEKEPNTGRKGAYKMRSPEEAEKELGLLKGAMAEAPNCRYGLWSNGLDLFYFEKELTRFDVKFHSIGDWPLADESIGTRAVASHAHMRRAEPEMLRVAFRRCHNFIHGNEGMAKDAAFWQFLYLIFCKMYDERQGNGSIRFWAGPTEQFDEAGRKAIKKRILGLFEDVKARYSAIFNPGFRVVSTQLGAKPRQTWAAAISGNLACAYAPAGWLGGAVMARTRLGSGIARDLKTCRTGCGTSFIRKKICVGV
jgi:type I restriction enzyme M protein